MIPRNYKGEGWQTDGARRWRSKAWRKWVREQRPVSAPNGHGLPTVIAAHFRYPGCGTGIRPADCLCYPMLDGAHKASHNGGQQSMETQWRWVTGTLLGAVGAGALIASPGAVRWLAELRKAANAREADLSTRGIEAVAERWAQLFVSGELELAADVWM